MPFHVVRADVRPTFYRMTQIPVSKGCYRLLSGLFLLSSLAMVVQGGDMVVVGLISAAICGWAFFSTF
jgi:hypothetical protein